MSEQRIFLQEGSKIAINLRMRTNIKNELTQRAKINGRSVNSEILLRLRESIIQEDNNSEA